MLTRHLAIMDAETAFYCIGGRIAGTISYGVFRTTPSIGGFFRIAVIPEFRNKGIGKTLLRFAEDNMKSREIYQIEEIIKLKRIPSLSMHFMSGYIPEIRYKERALKYKSFKRNAIHYLGYDWVIRMITKQLYKELNVRGS